MNKTRVLSKHTENFGISAKLQKVICLLAQDRVFEEAEELLSELLGIDVSAKQVQRVSEHYGLQLEEAKAHLQEGLCDVPLVVSGENSKTPVYVTIDGSMIFTREEGWKEIKVGRIYSDKSRIPIQKNRTEVMNSLYACSLGNNKVFFKKFEPYVEPYAHKVFIADGAKWIWNWVEDLYGDCVQIIDFFHAVEKLGAYAALAYKDTGERKQSLEEQKQRLRDDQVENVVVDLKNITVKTEEADKALKDI